MRLSPLTFSLAFGLALMASGADAQGPAPREAGPARQATQQQIRQRFGRLVQRELALDDAKMRRLQASLLKFDAPRRELIRRETEARRELRKQLRAGDSAQPSRVDSLLDEMLVVQKRRIELHEQEDRELRAFLTPVQRARFYGIQEQLRRRVEAVQAKRRPPGGGRPPPT